MTVCKGGIDMLDRQPEENSALTSRPQEQGAGNTESCDRGQHAGGQGDRVQQGIRMPKTSAYGLDFARSGCDGGSHLRCATSAAGSAGDHVEGA